jgi:hypothetical protein
MPLSSTAHRHSRKGGSRSGSPGRGDGKAMIPDHGVGVVTLAEADINPARNAR